MKLIVCTGDSHTCGQGADSIKTSAKPKDPNARYDTAGKGIGVSACDLETPGYVNLVREYLLEHTASRYAVAYPDDLAAQYGCTVERGMCVLDGELVSENSWELMLLCVAEEEAPAELAVYFDGVLHATYVLQTDRPRYNDVSYRNVPIRCAGVRSVRLVPRSGRGRLRHIQFAAGEYAVVNSGVGSCSSERYLEECLPYCVDAFRPDIIIAEGHSINDWIQYNSAQKHYETLKTLMQTFRANGAQVVFLTVAPIEGRQENAAGIPYGEFIAASKQMATELALPTADANEAFARALASIALERRSDEMYVDRWHVCGKGHRIYAECIIEQLKKLL